MTASKPGDMSALAIAAAKLSAGGSSSTTSARRRDSPREANGELAPSRDQHRSAEDVRRREDALLVFDDDAPSPREQACKLSSESLGSRREEKLGHGETLLVFDESPKSRVSRDEARQRGESPLRFDDDRPQREKRDPRDNFRLDDQAAPPGVRVFRALTAVPQDLSFTVPPNCRAGQPVCMQGPHGPIRVPLPQGYQRGERCTIRFGPSVLHQVAVPKGSRPGDTVKFEGTNGEQLEAVVPIGKESGDYFEVSPPVLMVQVPDGAVEGDLLCFDNPAGVEVRARVPKGIKPLQYFAARIDM